MDSAHGRGRRQPNTSASLRRDPDLDPAPRPASKDVKTASSSTSAHGGISSPKGGGPEYLSPWSNDSGKNLKLGDVVSRLGQPDGAGSKPNPTRDKTRNDRHKKDDPGRPKQAHSDSSSHSSASKGDGTKRKTKSDEKSSRDKKRDDDPYKRIDKQTSEASKTSSQTPKEKRRSRSASRPRDTQVGPAKESPTNVISSPGSADENRRGSIPVIWLSREDSNRRTELSAEPKSFHPQKRRMSALSQAKLAFEKVAMAITETEIVETHRDKAQKHGKVEKNRKSRSQSTPREIPTQTEEKHSGKKRKSHDRRLSRDVDTPERESFLEDGKHSKSMQHLVPKQQHRKIGANKKQSLVEGELSLEGASVTSSPVQSSNSTRRSSIPLKLFHSITRPSSIGTNSNLPSPQRQSTPSRPRKKFSRGHIDQDPLEVDYEVLDDRVTSVEPRKSIPTMSEPRRSIPTLENRKASVEEPLLSKHRESEIKSSSHTRESRTTKPTQRPTSMPYMQTFPRTKNQTSDLYSPMSAGGKSLRTSASMSSDRVSHFSSHQLNTPDSVFSSLYKIPSQSSFTSSDARSEVCLDLPDVTDIAEGDIQIHTADRETNDFRVKVGFPSAPYHRIVHYTQFSICFLIMSAISIFIASFILLWPLLVTIIVIAPVVVIIKRLCSLLCCCGVSLWGRCCLCLCHTHLTSSELMWLGRAATSTSSVVQCLLVLQKGLDTDRIRNLIDSRVLSMENRHGRRLYPRFTQKVVTFCCGQAWVTDHHFVVSRHVFNMPGYIETLEDLQQFISKMAGEPLSLDHPLWEVQVLHNFREPRDTVLLFRMHACMTDGVSLVQVLENALVDSQKITHEKRSFSAEISNTSPFKVLFSGPVTFFSKYLCLRPDFNLLHGRHIHLSGEMVVAWSEPFSLSAAMRVKQVARCTLSELLLSITAGNIRTYLQMSGVSHPFDIKCALPVDFQSMDGSGLDMENKYSLVLFTLPTNTEGAIPQLWQIKYNMGKFKSSAEAAIVNGARWLSSCLLPASFFQRLWRKIYSGCSLVIANLAGPTSVLKIDSREVKCMMFWMPPMDRAPVTISFITYADQIRMAVISERSVMPNPDLLTRDFIHKLEIMSKLLAHRRIPGETAATNKMENVHLLSSFTLDDLTAEQIQLEMSLVQQELHDLKIQLDSGPSNHISHNDTQLISRIEALKERSRELMMHLRKRKADESENAVVLSEEDDLESEVGTDKHQKPFRRRTLSMSSKMSTASVSSTARPLSTASTSNLPSPIHAALPSWPEGDLGIEELDESVMSKRGATYVPRTFSSIGIVSPVSYNREDRGNYHNIVS